MTIIREHLPATGNSVLIAMNSHMTATQTDFDVLIIGGGPSGSAAGTMLAREGLSVLITEKGPFAPFRIGESLLPNGNALLKEIGVWEKIEAAGFIQKYGAEFETADGTKRVHNIFANGITPGLDYTYQAERPKLDELMLDHACETGCQLDRNAEISRIEPLAEGYRVHCKDGRTFQSKWLMDASGRSRVLGRLFKLATDPNPYPSRIAVFNHFEKVARASGPEAGNIIITRRSDGWFWQIPISESSTSIGCVGLSSDLKASGLRPEAWFKQQVAQSPALAQRMESARAENQFQTTTDYSHMFTHFAGERYLLVGDAATFSDPIFSSGVYLGLASAITASRALLQAERNRGSLSREAQAAYTRDLKQQTEIIRELIDTFYDDAGFAVFMNPTNKFKLFPAVNSIVAGNTRPGFGVRWRYALFRLICRLNKNYRLVPKVL